MPVGAEFQVNAYSALLQTLPSVAADADGDFVVVWSCDGQSGTDVGSLSIQGQRYASDGSAQGAQFQVNTYTTNDQVAPAVASDPNGNFIVVWESNGSDGTDTNARSVQGQRYASDGSPLGSEFQVNSYTTQSQIHASVAADADGDFVVVWESNGSSGTDSSYRSIQGQRYASDGSTRGSEFQINTFTTNYQRFPAVAADASGNFFTVWQSYGSPGTDASGYSIQGQRYDSDGSTRGAEFQVNSYTPSEQQYPSVAADASGDFVVVWHSLGSSESDTSGESVQGQRYSSGGSEQGAEFQVDTNTANGQVSASVAADTYGDFVVVWSSYASESDPFLRNIEGQRYSVTAAVPATSSGTRFALATALLLLGAAVARAYGSASGRSRLPR